MKRFLITILFLLTPVSLCAQGPTPSGPAATGTPVCGRVADGTVHIPSDWATFTEPAMGGSYVDATFGCQVTRLTNGAAEFDTVGHSVGVYYATVTSMNADDSLVMVSLDNGSVWIIQNGLVTGHYGIAVSSSNMAGTQRNIWSRTNPLLFWYVTGNSLRSATIQGAPGCFATFNCTLSTALVHTFSEYASIGNMDETRISVDGHHILLEAQVTAGSSHDLAFLYDLVNNTKGPVYDSGCTGNINSGTNQDSCWHKNQVAGDNNFVLGAGNVLYFNGTTTVCVQGCGGGTSHYDTGLDLSGTSVFIDVPGSGSLTGQTNPCPSGQYGSGVNATGSIASVPINNPTNNAAMTCILDSVPPWHIGWGGNANQPWIMLSYFQEGSPMHFGTSGSYSAPSASNWGLYQGELDIVRADADQTSRSSNPKAYRLAHARSRSGESDFDAQVLANISFDGRYIVFNSNGAYGNTGCSGGVNWHVTGYCSDVYIISAPGGGGLFGGGGALAPPASVTGTLIP